MITEKKFFEFKRIENEGHLHMYQYDKVIKRSGGLLTAYDIKEIMEKYDDLNKKYMTKDSKQVMHKIRLHHLQGLLHDVRYATPSIMYYKFKKDKDFHKRFQQKVEDAINMLNDLAKAKMK